jgi:hypothetical protein
VKADLIARLLAAQVGGVSVSASPSSSSSSSSSRGGRAELLAAGVSAEDTDATEPATVKKDMTGYVKTVAEMVDADWHDGYEEQGEELDSYFKAMAKVAKAVYRVAVAKAVGFHRCNEVMKVCCCHNFSHLLLLLLLHLLHNFLLNRRWRTRGPTC